MMNNDAQITAVLFDWDLTLAYTVAPDATYRQRITVLFQEHGIDCTQETVEAALDRLKTAVRFHDDPAILYPQTRRDIIRKYRHLLRELAHFDTSRDFAYTLYSAYAHLPQFLYDDVRPTLAALQARGLKLGILSNHSRSVRPVMEQLVGDLIPPAHIVISEEEGVHKPSPTLFRRAAARLRTPPARCLYVGDNLQVDAIGAVERGDFGGGVWLNRKGQVADKRRLLASVKQIGDLRELLGTSL